MESLISQYGHQWWPLPYQKGIIPYWWLLIYVKFWIEFPEFVIFTYNFYATLKGFQKSLIYLQVSFLFRVSLQFNWFFVYEEPIIVSIFYILVKFIEISGEYWNTLFNSISDLSMGFMAALYARCLGMSETTWK